MTKNIFGAILFVGLLASPAITLADNTVVSPKDVYKTQAASSAELSVTLSPNDSDLTKIVIAGERSVLAGQFHFVARGLSYRVIALKVRIPISAVTAVSTVTLNYKDITGAAKTASAVTTLDGVATFTGLSLDIPENSSSRLDVYVDVNSVPSGAVSGTPISVALDKSDIKTITSAGSIISGIGSGTITSPSTLYVRKSIPTISAVALDNYELREGPDQTIARFKIAAHPAGDVSWGKIDFDVNKSANVSIGDASTLRLWKTSGNTVVGGTFTVVNDGPDNQRLVFTPTREETIAASASSVYELRTTVNMSPKFGLSYVTISIPSRSTSTVTDTRSGVIRNAVVPSFVWSDWSDLIDHFINESTAVDWANDYLVKNLPISIGSLQTVMDVEMPGPTITSVTGNQGRYVAGEPIKLKIIGMDGSGQNATNMNGYKVQAYIYPASDTSFSTNIVPIPADSYKGTYSKNAGVWKIRTNAPAIVGSYNIRIDMYCARTDAACGKAGAYGDGKHSFKVIPFSVIAPI